MTSVIVTSFPRFSIVILELFGSTDTSGSCAGFNRSFARISLVTGTALSGLGEASGASGGTSTGIESVGGIGTSIIGSWGLIGIELPSEIWVSVGAGVGSGFGCVVSSGIFKLFIFIF